MRGPNAMSRYITARNDVMEEQAGSVWLERTRSDHAHGGHGWELGSCLWSPATDRAGTDRYRVMREVRIGDVVFHLVDSILVGESVVATVCRTVNQEPPSPGPWGGLASYFRLDLAHYRAFAKPCSFSTLMREHTELIIRDLRTHEPERYPFFVSSSGTLFPVQGAYLTKCSPTLTDLIRRSTLEPPDSVAAT